MESNRKINCEDCAKRNLAPVSYFVHESIMVRQERTIRRLWILCLVLILCLVGTNLAWTVYENGFTDEITTTTIEAHSDGGSAIANESGEITINGIGEDNQNN